MAIDTSVVGSETYCYQVSAVDASGNEYDCSAGEGTTLSLDNVDISFSASWGIFVSDENRDKEIGANVTYFNNTLGNINFP